LLKIVSGGQTGVDRGALDAALHLGVECGGWCPAGRLAEDGVIPERYPVTELKGGGYAERTARNVADADGTLIFSNGEPIGGTRETVERCVEMQKPYLVVDCKQLRTKEATALALGFASDLSFRAAQTTPVRPGPGNPTSVRTGSDHREGPSHSLGMTTLNVAGPRASQWPDGHAFTYQIMSAILCRISGQSHANE
jgi:Circularly permutated YpsA SLOG family